METEEIPRQLKHPRWRTTVLIVLLLLFGAGLYTWMYLQRSCDVIAVQEASSFLTSQQKTYDAQYQFATTVSRASLDIPVRMLEEIRLDTKQVRVPACMRTAQDELVSYMSSVVSAFQSYMAEDTETTIRGYLSQSDRHYDRYKKELDAVNKCAPFCLPW